MFKWSVAAVLSFLLAPAPLSGHAYLVKSVPAQRAVLLRTPARIQLWFNERLEPRYSSIAISDSGGNPVDTGKSEVGVDDPKQLSTAIKSLPAGRYLVKYRVLSVDGHIVQDQFPFTIKQ
jgi:methionine-rich copper-binding protein CopC